MKGVLNVLKPPGMTSHDVVNFIRRLTKVKKVGHTGTLDPGAAGVLAVCLGPATRIIRFLNDDKKYRVEITFGISTSTGDAEGEVIQTCDASALSCKSVGKILNDFKGDIEQTPPMASAVHYKGKRLYELARAGQVVERKTRQISIYDLSLVRQFHWGTKTPKVFLDVCCSSGTYIRTLCMDIGQKLGCGAYMSFLLRTRAGAFTLEEAWTLEEIAMLYKEGRLGTSLVDMNKALDHLPAVQVRADVTDRVRAGNRLFPGGLLTGFEEQWSAGSQLVRLCSGQSLLAVARVEENPTCSKEYYFQPVVVLDIQDL